MVYSAIISMIVLLIILAQMYFIGKYISIKQEMFNNNKYSSFVMGFIVYFVISFGVFFIFIFFKVPIIYFVIFFAIKDVIQITYLMVRREMFFGMKIKVVDVAITLFVAIGLVFAFNYLTPLFETLRFRSSIANFQSWYKFQEIISKITVIDINFIYKWFGSILISFFAYSSVMSFTHHFAKKNYWWLYIVGAVVSLMILFGFTFGLQMESGIGPFIILFAIQAGLNIIVYSRRRYATMYGLITVAAWSFNPELFLVLLLIAFSILVIYTIMQKPKVSLFWVQLMAPLAIVSTFWINDFSRPLGLAVMLIAIFLYAFMVSVGRVKVLDKLNDLFIKMRFAIPIAIFITIIIIAITLGLVEGDRDSKYIVQNTTYLFDVHGSDIINYIQIGAYSFTIFALLGYCVYLYVYKKKMVRIRLVPMLAAITITFALNPGFWLVIANTLLEPQFKYLSLVIIPPLLLSGITSLPTVLKSKKITYA